MTALKRLPKPTDAELEILNVLWRLEAGTVRDVHSALRKTSSVRYTTVLKLMQIMTAKGLLKRDETERAHVYRPVLRQEDTQRQLVGELLDRAFGGSASALVLRALSARPASRRELDEIRHMLDNVSGKANHG